MPAMGYVAPLARTPAGIVFASICAHGNYTSSLESEIALGGEGC